MKEKVYKYSHGLPFSQDTADNIDTLKKRVAGNKASLIIIDGGIGEGKTTLAVELADYIQESPIDFKKQLAIGGEEFTKKLKICFAKKLPVIIYDEAGDFNKRASLTAFNGMLNRIFETFRVFKIIVILVLPNFHVLDSSLFSKQIPRFLFHCFNRNQHYGNYKVYSLYRMYYIKNKMEKLVVKPQAYTFTRPNLKGSFLDLPPERAKELNEITLQGKLDILKSKDLEYKGLLTIQNIADKLKTTHKAICRRIEERQIPCFEKIDGINYYRIEDLDLFRLRVPKEAQDDGELEE